MRESLRDKDLRTSSRPGISPRPVGLRSWSSTPLPSGGREGSAFWAAVGRGAEVVVAPNTEALAQTPTSPESRPEACSWEQPKDRNEEPVRSPEHTNSPICTGVRAVMVRAVMDAEHGRLRRCIWDGDTFAIGVATGISPSHRPAPRRVAALRGKANLAHVPHSGATTEMLRPQSRCRRCRGGITIVWPDVPEDLGAIRAAIASRPPCRAGD
jgi:hypothetical protein